MAVPMLKENELIGACHPLPPRSSSVHRQADRVGQELRRSSRHRHRERAVAQRTASAHRHDLTEALEQQTATSEVLQVIRAPPVILSPFLQPCSRSRSHLRRQHSGNIYRWDGEAFASCWRLTILRSLLIAEARQAFAIRLTPDGYVAAWSATKRSVHIADLAADPAYAETQSRRLPPSNLAACGRSWLSRC